jgi:hypothetical protein
MLPGGRREMSLSALHVLLTYQCNYQCDHCFVWGSPRQTGVFSLARLEEVYRQALELGTLHTICFEGGEVFLYHPILVQAVARARARGFRTGIVSNAYWATNADDAVEWLRPLVEAGLEWISLSSDLFHGDAMETAESRCGLAAARQLGLEAGTIRVEPPPGYRDLIGSDPDSTARGGGVMYRGRAAETLVEGLPRRPWESFASCPHEDLADPDRVHLDPLGNLHLCQGLVMGNLFERPLAQIVREYDPAAHPVVGPLLEGGPAGLVRRFELRHQPGYVDACHLCDSARRGLRSRFPETLGPDQMYGAG